MKAAAPAEAEEQWAQPCMVLVLVRDKQPRVYARNLSFYTHFQRLLSLSHEATRVLHW